MGYFSGDKRCHQIVHICTHVHSHRSIGNLEKDNLDARDNQHAASNLLFVFSAAAVAEAAGLVLIITRPTSTVLALKEFPPTI